MPALEDRPHSARCDLDTELLKFALDASVAPCLVLRCETDDEAADLPRLGRAALLARIGPATRHKGPVPAHYGLRAHEQSGPPFLRKHARSGGNQHAVVRPEIWPLRLTAEDVHLVAENPESRPP
jgi:hypothetical protein